MAQPLPRYTADEYLALERQGETRHEFIDGEIFTMAGASRRHNSICAALTARLFDPFLERPCEVWSSDMRVKVEATGLYIYPDVVAVCGEPTFEDAEVDTLLDPIVIIEVLSPSTADYDRGAKFEHYRAIPTLREYLLIAQDEVHIVHYVRQDDGRWLLGETRDPAARISLTSVEVELRVAEIYAKVRFGNTL